MYIICRLIKKSQYFARFNKTRKNLEIQAKLGQVKKKRDCRRVYLQSSNYIFCADFSNKVINLFQDGFCLRSPFISLFHSLST